jgi:hypothetical protein
VAHHKLHLAHRQVLGQESAKRVSKRVEVEPAAGVIYAHDLCGCQVCVECRNVWNGFEDSLILENARVK